VRTGRATNNRPSYRDAWWVFGEPRRELRAALCGLTRYIGTVETTKHRTFQFVDAATLPDNMVIAIACEEPHVLGILGSRIALEWTYANSGLIGVARFEQGHRYTKSNIFDPFPFPDLDAAGRWRIGELAEELDGLRKAVLAAQDDLTLTILYNLLALVKDGAALSARQEDQRRRGRVDVIAELHDRIDAAVADAYGWPVDLPAAAIVGRLVALNATRRAEEQAGTVRWLRPDYQIARAGLTALPVARAREEQIAAPLAAAAAGKPGFPRDPIGQTAMVLADLHAGGAPSVEEIARRYAQGRRIERRVQATLEALIRLGHVSMEGGRYRLRRVA
jgi:hypothetical protein